MTNDESARPDPPRVASPLVIGLMGGVASGKSTVAKRFEEAGFERIDADAEARRAVEEPGPRAAIEARFGPRVFAADGSLDRAALGALVFEDADARRDLEAIIHPIVRKRILARIEAARSAGRPALLDIPLLHERGWIEHCDRTVFVEAPDALRDARAADRGWAPGERARREAAQAPLDVKRAAADHIIVNSRDLSDLHASVDALLTLLMSLRGRP